MSKLIVSLIPEQVKAKDEDTGRWGKLCYSLSGDGVRNQQPGTDGNPCSLQLLHSAQKRNQDIPAVSDVHNQTGKITDYLEIEDAKNEPQKNGNKDRMRKFLHTKKRYDEYENAFVIDPNTGTISVIRVSTFIVLAYTIFSFIIM